MDKYYDEGAHLRPQRNAEYYSPQLQPTTFSKQNEQKNYPIGDSKDVDVGHTNIINNINDYDRSESQQYDNEKQKHIYEKRTNNYFGKNYDQKQYLRSNFGYQSTLKELGDYQQDEKDLTKKEYNSIHQMLQKSDLNSSTIGGYNATNEITTDFVSDKDTTTNRNQLFKNKTKHQEIIRKLYDYDQSTQVNDTLTKAEKYMVESPKSHGELINIFSKNHKINPTKFQDSSLTSPTEEHFQRMMLNSNYDPLTLKTSMGRRNSKPNLNKSSFIQHIRCEQQLASSAAAAAAEHQSTYKTGRFIDTIKKPIVHKKPVADLYQKNPYNSYKNYQFDTITQTTKNLHKKYINDNPVEIKYTNNKFAKNNDINHYCQINKDINNYNTYDDCQDDYTTTGGLCNKSSSASQIKDESTSFDKLSNETKDYTQLTKNKDSPHSNRSKRSYNTHNSRKLEDMFNIQQSKCDIINVITDGMQKMSHSRYDLISPGRPILPVSTAVEKCSQTHTINNGDYSSNDKSVSSVSTCNIFEPMLKEYKKYHLHNIKEEAQRLERLEHLSNKIEI